MLIYLPIIFLFILAIAITFANPFFRFRKFLKAENEVECEQWPDITILLTTHKNALQLENNIENYLHQDYPGNYELVVVAEKGDSETEDVLKRHAANEKLYYTFIPKSSRYMSRKKLAVTLGIKAAHYDWIVMSEPECAPTSESWLKEFAKGCTADSKLVMGYCKFDEETPSYYRFSRLQTSLYLMRKALKKTAFRTDCPLLAFNKSTFIDGDGYRGYLQFIGGEYDFLVNKYAERGNTSVRFVPQAWLTESEPRLTKWRNQHLYYMDARRYLKRRHSVKALFNFDNTLLHIFTIATIATIAFSIIVQEWIVLGASVCLWAVATILRYVLAKPVMQYFEEPFGLMTFHFYDLTTIYHNAMNMLRYWRADKYDFTTHKQ